MAFQNTPGNFLWERLLRVRNPFGELNGINPYIALSDILTNLCLWFAVMVIIVGTINARFWEDAQYKKFQQEFEASVNRRFPKGNGPQYRFRHDAPGEQRWMFPVKMLFGASSMDLSEGGKRALQAFAGILVANKNLWWRIRVEAHTHQPSRHPSTADELHAMQLTANRAVVVAMYLYKRCHVEPYRVVASGRGYQDLIREQEPTSLENDRVDILVIPYNVGQGALH